MDFRQTWESSLSSLGNLAQFVENLLSSHESALKKVGEQQAEIQALKEALANTAAPPDTTTVATVNPRQGQDAVRPRPLRTPRLV